MKHADDGVVVLGVSVAGELDLAVLWWRSELDRRYVDEYIRKIETDSQLAAGPIRDGAVPGATLARASRWVDPESGQAISVELGCRAPGASR